MKKSLAKQQWTEKGGVIYTTGGFSDYRIARDHDALLNMLVTLNKPTICECALENQTLVLFFDIDVKKPIDGIDLYLINERGEEALSMLLTRISHVLKDYKFEIYGLTSHEFLGLTRIMSKFSIHLVVRIYNDEGTELIFQNPELLGNFIAYFFDDLPVWAYDRSVPKAGGFLFRTIYSSKVEKDGSIPMRPLLKYETPEIKIPDNDKKYLITYHSATFSLFPHLMKMLNAKPKHVIKANQIVNISTLNAVLAPISLSRPQFTEMICPHALTLATNLLDKFSKDCQLVINRLLNLKVSAEPTPTVIISYEGECYITKKKHKSNNCFISITSEYISAKCHNASCQNNIKWDTNQILNDAQFEILTGKHTLMKHIQDYLPSIDMGNPEISLIDGIYIGEITDLIVTKYNNFISGTHRFDGFTHGMARGGISTSVAEYEESGTANLLVKFENCTFNQTINYSNLDNSKRSKEKNNQLQDGWLVEIIDKIVSINLDKIEILRDIEPELKAWADNPCSDMLGPIIGILMVKQNVVYVSPNYIKWSKYKWVWVEDILLKRLIILEPIKSFFLLLESMIKEYIDKAQYIKEFRKLKATSLIGTSFLSIQSYASNVVHLPDFSKKLDSNWGYIPFLNGLYNLSNNTFGNFSPSAFNTFCINYNYTESIIDEINSFLKDLFPVEIERQFALEIIAAALDDSIPNDKIYFLVGNGCNGKSLFLKLIKRAFGRMAVKLPSHFFACASKDTNAPTPQIENLENVRLALVSEPPQSDFSTNLVKEFCGGEDINSRGMYSSKINEFDMRTTFLVCANDMPNFDTNDDAIWRRVEILTFRTKFVDTPTNPNEKRIDVSLALRIKTDIEWHQSFMAIILENKKNLSSKHPNVPKSCVFNKKMAQDDACEVILWLKSILVNERNSFVRTKDVFGLRYGEDPNKVNETTAPYKTLSGKLHKYVISLNKILGENSLLRIDYGSFNINGGKLRGFKNLRLKREDEDMSGIINLDPIINSV